MQQHTQHSHVPMSLNVGVAARVRYHVSLQGPLPFSETGIASTFVTGSATVLPYRHHHLEVHLESKFPRAHLDLATAHCEWWQAVASLHETRNFRAFPPQRNVNSTITNSNATVSLLRHIT